MSRSRKGQIERLISGTILALCIFLAVHHVAVLFSESITWDEFGLYRRVQDVITTGIFRTGGRPGLAMLWLLPLVEGCTDPMEVAIHARMLWLVFTLGYPVTLFLLLREFLSARGTTVGTNPSRNADPLLGIAGLVLIPLWLRWSVQVRTDQPALFFVFLSGVVMMRSSKTAELGVVSGVLACSGFLFSQKAVYGGGIVAILAVTHAWIRGELFRKSALLRLAYFALGGAAVYGLFHNLIAWTFVPAPTFSIEGGMRQLETAGSSLEYRLYPYVSHYFLPQALMLLGLCACTVQARRGQIVRYQELIAAWLILLVGAGVARFHTNGFAYFWLTIGCFPAAAVAISLGPIREIAQTKRWGQRLLQTTCVALPLILIGQNVAEGRFVLEDTQRAQRDAFSFIDRNFLRSAPGFHADGGLFCREAKGHFPVVFGIHLQEQFYGEKNSTNVTAFIETFRTLPVEFLIRTPRLEGFPRPIIEFWEANYVPYSSNILVPGFHLEPDQNEINVLVPGKYRWFTSEKNASPPHVNSQPLLEEGDIELHRGVNSIQASSRGSLVRSLLDRPRLTLDRFYSRGSIREISLRR